MDIEALSQCFEEIEKADVAGSVFYFSLILREGVVAVFDPVLPFRAGVVDGVWPKGGRGA